MKKSLYFKNVYILTELLLSFILSLIFVRIYLYVINQKTNKTAARGRKLTQEVTAIFLQGVI